MPRLSDTFFLRIPESPDPCEPNLTVNSDDKTTVTTWGETETVNFKYITGRNESGGNVVDGTSPFGLRYTNPPVQGVGTPTGTVSPTNPDVGGDKCADKPGSVTSTMPAEPTPTPTVDLIWIGTISMSERS